MDAEKLQMRTFLAENLNKDDGPIPSDSVNQVYLCLSMNLRFHMHMCVFGGLCWCKKFGKQGQLVSV